MGTILKMKAALLLVLFIGLYETKHYLLKTKTRENETGSDYRVNEFKPSSTLCVCTNPKGNDKFHGKHRDCFAKDWCFVKCSSDCVDLRAMTNGRCVSNLACGGTDWIPRPV